MATFFFGSLPFPSHTLTRTHQVYSSSQPPPPPPDQTPIQAQQLSVTSDELKPKTVTNPKRTSVESTDWIASSLTRRFGLGAGLAWAGFLAFGVSYSLLHLVESKLIFVVKANSSYLLRRDVKKQEEILLPNGIRYTELRVGGGASPRTGDLIVLNLKGQVEGSGEVFVDTYGGETKKPLALVMGSRPYNKGMCEGLQYVLKSMKAGGKRRVIIPPNLGFGEGNDLGSGVQIPPSATLDYVVELDRVSIAPA